MKKILAILLSAIICAFTLTACGGKTNNPPVDVTVPTETADSGTTENTNAAPDETQNTPNQQQDSTSAEAAISEACKFFSVNLPESWRGKYSCSKESRSITFFHKASKKAGKSGRLFMISIEEKMQADDALGDGSYEVCRLIRKGKEYSIVISPAMEEKPFTKDTKKQYKKMLKLLKTIEKNITPTDKNDKVKFLDYSKYTGQTYLGTYKKDATYLLHIESADHSVLTGTLEWEAPQDRENFKVQITMFDNKGNMVWESESDGSYGSGSFRDDGKNTYLSFEDWRTDFSTGEIKMEIQMG